MKVNISKLPDGIRERMADFAEILDFEFKEGGYVINATEGNKLSVEFADKVFNVTYPSINQFYRAMLLLKKSFDKKGFSVSEKFIAGELGVMVDCSRNAVKSVAHVKEILRHLALMGYNQLQLYTEDTYEVEGEPYFGYMRGRYTTAELKEIDDYAYSLGIEVVPCIQTLAHLNQIFKWNAYKGINDCDDILLVDEPRTYELIDNMFKAVKKAFRSNKLHIGMDEAHMLGRGKYADKHGASENRSDIMLRHLNKVVEMAKDYGFEPMMWSDMFFRLQFNGEYRPSDPDAQISSEVAALVPEGLRLVYWDYYSDEAGYDSMIEKHQAFANEIMFAGGAWTWCGFVPHNAWSIKATKAAMRSCKKANIQNILITLWGDDGAECCSVMSVLPTLVEAAEIMYSGTDAAGTFKALTDIGYDQFMELDSADVLDVNMPAHAFNPAKYMLFNDAIGGIMDARVSTEQSKIYEQYAKNLRMVEKQAGRYEYLFTLQRTLCEVLELKYELGLRTRAAYKSGDPAAVKALIKSNYNPLIGKLESFYEAFVEMWDTENKPYGFEVHDYRIGGLIQRTKHCIDRLEAYANGKIKSVPELEEVMLDPFGNTADIADKRLVRYNSFASTISAGKLSW